MPEGENMSDHRENESSQTETEILSVRLPVELIDRKSVV